MNQPNEQAIPQDDVPQVIGKEPNQLGIRPPQFVKSPEKYWSFTAEVAIVDAEDFVIHFFRRENSPRGEAWWEETFPMMLDRIAQTHFGATYPRLKAARVNELGIDSWWFRAYGFATQALDPDAFIDKFYEKLHAALASVNRT